MTQTVVVTGAASGIGAGIAELLAARGATVIGLDLKPAGPGEAWSCLDLADPISIAEVAARLPDRVDVLCNVAGLHPRSAEGNEIVAVNYLGTRLLTEHVAERMPAGGTVVNMASSTGMNWQARLPHHRELIAITDYADANSWLAANPVERTRGYSTSKELLCAWTVLTAAAWLGRGIRINAVAPGPVETAAFLHFREMSGHAPNPDVDRVGRAGQISDVARTVAFLCSDDSVWVNGVVLPIDGGLQATFVADGVTQPAL